jgi:hypothetical protein
MPKGKPPLLLAITQQEKNFIISGGWQILFFIDLAHELGVP